MKTKTINQEILLMTTTTFACRDWCEKDVQSSKVLSAEQLEEACWNGLLEELLPSYRKKVISPADHSMQFIFGNRPVRIAGSN